MIFGLKTMYNRIFSHYFIIKNSFIFISVLLITYINYSSCEELSLFLVNYTLFILIESETKSYIKPLHDVDKESFILFYP